MKPVPAIRATLLLRSHLVLFTAVLCFLSSTSVIANAQGMSVATRRCIELGGAPMACAGTSLLGGLLGGLGAPDEANILNHEPTRAGVVLSGNYHNPATLASIGFGPDGATIDACGNLAADGHKYVLRKTASSVQITIASEPSPIMLTLHPNGSLTGPGGVTVKGRTIIGYNTVTQYVNGYPNGSTSTPIYRPSIQRCTIAALEPPPPNPPAAAKPQPSGLMGAFTGMLDSVMPTPEPGLRMTGKYSSSSGLLLDFRPDAVTLDCGQAHVKQPYTVEDKAVTFVIHVKNNGGAFDLFLASDKTLRGSGSTTVNGRLLSSESGSEPSFIAHSETCAVSTLTPTTAAASSSVTASAASLAAYLPAVTPATAPAPSSNLPAAAASGAFRVTIAAIFPAGANPLAGRPVFVMREPMNSVLRKLGLAVPANATPGQAMEAFYAACHSRDCSSILRGMAAYTAATSAFNGSGKVTFAATTAAPGRYYIFALVQTASGTLFWDVPTNLVPGDNTINLTLANVVHIR